MAPKMGRPPKADASRKVNLNIRLTEAESEAVKKCADMLGISRTDAIMKGIYRILGEK